MTEKLITFRFDILKMKHWQLILALFPAAMAFEVIRAYVSSSLPFQSIDVLFILLEPVFYLSYPLLTWMRLNDFLADQSLFESVNARKVLLALGIVMIANAIGHLYNYSIPHFVVVPIAAFCLLFLASLPAKQLRSIELKRNAGIWEYTWETFQFATWPLGVLWIQPRLNDVPEKRIIIKE